MREIVPFKKEHFHRMNLHPVFENIRPYMTDEMLTIMEKEKYAYSLIRDGEILACSGITTIWQDRGEAWTFFGNISKPDFLFVFRAVKKFLDLCEMKRIEASILEGFDASHRWIKLLGFTLEAPSRPKYTPDGKNYALYARIK